MQYLHSILLLLLILAGNNLQAQDIPEPMNPPRLVNDFSGLLQDGERNYIEKKLRNYHDTTSNQIYVVITSDLAGYDISDYAQRLGQKWKVGQKGKDNGIVMVIKPKTSRSRGQAFIATGYGLEESVPDAIARRIVDNEMIALFAQDKYARGINQGIDAIIGLASGKYKADRYKSKKSNSNDYVPVVGIVALMLLFCTGFNRKNGKLSYSAQVPLYILLSLLSNGRGGGSSFGNFSSGSGGFSGGGGGSFGGGGAGGSW